MHVVAVWEKFTSIESDRIKGPVCGLVLQVAIRSARHTPRLAFGSVKIGVLGCSAKTQTWAKTNRYRFACDPQRMIHIDQVCVEHADESAVLNRENAGSFKGMVRQRRAMKQWKLNELEARKVPVEELVIMTPDPMIYVAEVRENGVAAGILTNKGERCRTRSLEAMKQLLGRVPHKAAWLEHQSAFDEMIGLQSANDSNLRAPITIGMS